MLVQMPRVSSEQTSFTAASAKDDFEEALRRDLATAPVVSYGAMLGGASKRALDLSIALLLSPLWAPALLLTAAWAKLRHKGRVLLAEPRVGYAGREFACYRLQMELPSAKIEHLFAANEPAATALSERELQAQARRTKLREAVERLPQLLNVLRGEMALVGPLPLSREALADLKTAKRYYLSSRPGVTGVAFGGQDPLAQCKLYANAWSLTTDARMFGDAVKALTSSRHAAKSQEAV